MDKLLLKYKLIFPTQILLIGCLLIGIPLNAQVPFVCQNNFYFSFGSSFGTSQMHEVVITPNGDIDFVPLAQNTGVSLNAIGYRSTDNLIYGISTMEERLYKIDATGRGFPLTILDVDHDNGFYAATITPDGKVMIVVEQTNGFGGGSIALVKIDLTDDTYPILSRVSLTGTPIATTDIAFDPITGILYGFDARDSRLVTINPDNGGVNAGFPSSAVADRMGGLYFDAFGNMFGYGNAQQESEARTFFGIDKNNGQVRIIGKGPNTSSKDGCACPFTIDLLKSVNPRQVVPCTEVTYTFEISNLSGTERTGVILTDTMPEDFIILRLESNPYGGTFSGVGSNILLLEDMTIPLGQDSIKVVIETLPFAQGIYKNQAHLGNLPDGLGGRTPSDDPITILTDDSTTLEVLPLVVDLENQRQNLCEGSTIELVAGTIAGVSYEWNTGNREAVQLVTLPGLYAVTITNGCETEIDSVTISEEPISVNLGDNLSINLGDYVTLHPITNAIGQLQYIWSKNGEVLPCTNCSSLEIRPFFDSNYTLEIISPSGCTATANIYIEVTKDRGIYIPNVFSPNNDGINDNFYIMGKGYAQILVFQIFDRWGNVVFSQNQGSINDPTIGWNGTFTNKSSEVGVFSYYAKLVYLDEIEESFFGDITLVR